MALFKKHKRSLCRRRIPRPRYLRGDRRRCGGGHEKIRPGVHTRVWEGLPKLVIRWLMVAFSAYCIIDTVFLSTRQEVRLPMFVGLILLFGFLTFPAKKGDERVNHMPWYDIVLLIAARRYFSTPSMPRTWSRCPPGSCRTTCT